MVSVVLTGRDIVFLHVPKTAGGSISRSLRNEADAAIYPVENMKYAEPCVRQLQRRLPKRLSEYRSFAVVRNPWDWTVSGYLHVTQNLPAYRTPPSFGDFIRGDWQHATEIQYPTKFETPKAYVAYHTQISQWEHLCDNRDELEIEDICRFETLEMDLRKVLGDQVSLPHANKSDRKPYAEYYDETTKRLVAERNDRLIDRFGYRFEDC